MANDFTDDGEKGVPVTNPPRSPLAEFREEAAQGRIATAAGKDGRSFPPRFAAASGQLDLGTETGQGVVYSATRVERRGDPYTLALVDLPGGGRVLGQLHADDPAMLIGRTVRLAGNGQSFLTFTPEKTA